MDPNSFFLVLLLLVNSLANSSNLVIVLNFSISFSFATKQRQVNFLSDYVIHYVIELYDTYIINSDRYT